MIAPMVASRSPDVAFVISLAGPAVRGVKLIPLQVGALLGRFFFLRRYGAMWRQYAPVLLAGFSCGMGLTGMFAMGITLILKSLGRLAY